MNVLTWDGYDINDGAIFTTGMTSPILGNAPVQAQTVQRHGRYPLVGGVARGDKTILLTIIIESATPATARATLRTVFETESGEIKTLVIEGDDGTEQYVQAVCEALYEEDEVGNVYFASLKIHDDTAWRGTAVQTDTETVITSGQQWTITNDGDQIARPTITITPLTTQPNTNAYRRFVAVYWRGDGAADYPTDIVNDAFDTAALVTASKMQADGDDIRVLVNGVLVDYWLDDINTNNTSVWVNLNWQAGVALTAAVAIAGTGVVETVDVAESIDGFPSSGILQIDDELFLYTGKNNGLKRFTGTTRAAHGTVEAAHTVGDDVKLIQHAIEIQYGNSSMAAYPSLAYRKPIFALATSTNAAWDYDEFGAVTYAQGQYWTRTGSWSHTGQYQRPSDGRWVYTWYSESQFPPDAIPSHDNETVIPWQVVGLYEYIYSASTPSRQVWSLTCPCGLTAANFQNGYKKAVTNRFDWNGFVVSTAPGLANIYEYTIPIPSTNNAWQTWSVNDTSIRTGTRGIRLELAKITNIVTPANTQNYLEAGDVTLTFDTALTPTSYIAPEVGNYTIDATLEHVESGWALVISYAGGIDVSLVIDTDNGNITNTADGSSQFQAVRRFPRPRVEWLPLLPGTNTLKWTEVGVVEIEVTFQWRERRGA